MLACDDALQPPRTEDVYADADATVTVTLIDRGGFPDRIADYDVRVEAAGHRLSVLTGWAQQQSVSHQVRATRRGERIVVALGNDLCLVDVSPTTSACIDLADIGADVPASARFADAIAWRAADETIDGVERERAAIALSQLRR